MTLRGYYAILNVRGGPAANAARVPQGAAVVHAQAVDAQAGVAQTVDAQAGVAQTVDAQAGVAQAVVAQAVERATRLIEARPCMLQIRAKDLGAGDLAAIARAVLPAARAAGVPLCVNDRLDVALAVGADAVHLGQDDLPLPEAREIARGKLLIGISTHNPAQARTAIAGGADYIGFGPIFATTSKANPDPVVGIAALRLVATDAGIPVVAIGGIILERIAEVAATGASAAALIGAVETAADPVSAGRAINAAFGVSSD